MSPYSHLARFHVGVDCIIFGVRDCHLNVLLVKRDFEPEKGKQSLIGGFVSPDESVDVAAKRVLHSLTGLEDVYIRQLAAFGAIDRDPGARVISVAYFALLNINDVDNDVLEKHHAEWVDVNNLPALGFDHREMIEQALHKIRSKILSAGLAFNLLPEYFTLTQLQTLVEVVTGQTLDKRNFRKRIADNPAIVATDIIDKKSSKRGARLYRYLTTQKNA